MIKTLHFALALVSGALLAVAGAQAAEVFKWVDADGVTHYSESPPADDTPAETLTLESTGPGGMTAGDDFYSVLNQARRMEAARRADEALRIQRRAASRAAEIEALQAELDAARAEAEANRETVQYFPVFTRVPHFRFPHIERRHGDRLPHQSDRPADEPERITAPKPDNPAPRAGGKKGWAPSSAYSGSL
jgi:hypothetical protein